MADNMAQLGTQLTRALGSEAVLMKAKNAAASLMAQAGKAKGAELSAARLVETAEAEPITKGRFGSIVDLAGQIESAEAMLDAATSDDIIRSSELLIAIGADIESAEAAMEIAAKPSFVDSAERLVDFASDKESIASAEIAVDMANHLIRTTKPRK